jgi:hypothetical protein
MSTMALNLWWSGDPGERYWMEITTAGGVLLIWRSWTPAADDLSITRYRYDLPAAGQDSASQP